MSSTIGLFLQPLPFGLPPPVFGHDHCHLLYAIVVARTLPASAWVEEKGGFQTFIRIAIEEKE
jgi:hypothetical protein